PANPAIDECRDDGIVVLVGDAADRALLRKARVHEANDLFAFSGDDAINMEVALAAQDLVPVGKKGSLTGLVHILDVVQRDRLRESTDAGAAEDRFPRRFFDIAERGAPAMLHEHPGFVDAAAGVLPHLLVVGLGQMGTNLVVHAAGSWGIIRPAAGPLRVTAIDKEPEEKQSKLRNHYRWLKDWTEGACPSRCARRNGSSSRR
ncbi:MAG: NAD-binding protein, partial [Actinomycetota bacterium]